MFQSNNNALIEYVIFDKIKIIAKNYGINWSQNGNDKFWPPKVSEFQEYLE